MGIRLPGRDGDAVSFRQVPQWHEGELRRPIPLRHASPGPVTGQNGQCGVFFPKCVGSERYAWKRLGVVFRRDRSKPRDSRR